jgi:hypothetical protein
VNGDFGAKLFQLPNHRGAIGVFTGIQYWREQHEASGVVQNVCNPVTVPPICNPAQTGQDRAPGQQAITNTATWISWRLGVEGDYRVTRRFSLEGKFAFKPITSLSNDDIHHLRQPPAPLALQQDPSFHMTGTGIGADVDVGASYLVTPRFSLNLGYRFWWNHVADGDVTAYPVGAAPITINLNEFQTYRHGMTLGLQYIF